MTLGAPVGVQTRIGNQANQVSGKVYYYPLAGQDFKCGLENPPIESAR